jgi:hypothetical protein
MLHFASAVRLRALMIALTAAYGSRPSLSKRTASNFDSQQPSCCRGSTKRIVVVVVRAMKALQVIQRCPRRYKRHLSLSFCWNKKTMSSVSKKKKERRQAVRQEWQDDSPASREI